jgi:hypothetical protein
VARLLERRPSATTVGARLGPPRTYGLEIFLVSCAGLLLEIAYTRIISFKLFYYWTYLIIGLALLGIGSGGVLVALSGRLRRAATDTILLWGMLLGAATVGIGYIVVARTRLDTLEIWEYGTRSGVLELARLVLVCLAMFSTFLAIGVTVATLLGRTERIGRLYFLDLLGAGLACAVVVSLIASVGAVATVFLAGLLLALGALRLGLRRPAYAVASGALALLLAVGLVNPDSLPRQLEDPVKEELTDGNTIFSKWSPIFRVDVSDFGDRRVLFHDALLGSVIFQFDGDASKLDRFDTDPRSLPFSVLGRPPGNAMIIGAAGGHEILASLYFETEHVDAVELNPVTHDLVTDEYADYAGHLGEQPGVNYVTGDGRSFLARSDDTYDLIWYPAPDSYAATNAATAGAFVLSESYLYTSDTIEESLEHLGDDGIIATQYAEYDYAAKPNRTSRYVSTARHALARAGIDDPTDHILVATSGASGATNDTAVLSTILLKRTPFTPEEVTRFTDQLEQVEATSLQYSPSSQDLDNTVSDVVTLPDDELEGFYDDYPYDIRPITDDGPFFWHFKPLGSVLREMGKDVDRTDLEDAVGERVLILLLGVATAFAAVFLLLPFLAIRRTWAALPRKGTSAVYFLALGLGFMFFEITLIQRLILFLGYPTYSLTVTLASILVFTGIGALLSERWAAHAAQAVPVLLVALVALTAFYLWGLPPLTDAALEWPLAPRVLVAFLVLAPLGLCLGHFMPLGLRAVSRTTPHGPVYVAWGWAVNGFASVIGAVLTTMLAMTYGFRVVLVLALGVYLVALLALRVLVRAQPATPIA